MNLSREIRATLFTAVGLTLALSVVLGWGWPWLGDARAGIIALGIAGLEQRRPRCGDRGAGSRHHRPVREHSAVPGRDGGRDHRAVDHRDNPARGRKQC